MLFKQRHHERDQSDDECGTGARQRAYQEARRVRHGRFLNGVHIRHRAFLLRKSDCRITRLPVITSSMLASRGRW